MTQRKTGITGDILKEIFISLVTSAIVLGILYFLKFQYLPDFMSKYSFFIFFSVLSVSILTPAVNQVRSYKEFPCMSGMMVGMTLGMISSFLPGFYVASTNGMFYGSVIGMAIGVYFGVTNGKCCGIMGVMEGLMSAFMGGLMGAMTSFMLLNDHLKYAAVIVFVISAVIMFCLNYMIFKESSQLEESPNNSQIYTIILSIILTAIITLIIVYGPRGGFFQ